GLPKSNVLLFDLSDKAWMCVRPSGTEPKIKIYFGVVGESMEDADAKSKKFVDDVMKYIDTMM
nr:phospho-sugar mutase [Lachnospiraceae bacterium]